VLDQRGRLLLVTFARRAVRDSEVAQPEYIAIAPDEGEVPSPYGVLGESGLDRVYG